MKRLTKILLRIGAFLSLFVGVQLLGFAFFAPAMHTEGLGVELLTDQLLAASGGRGRLTMAGAAATILCIVLQRMVRTVRQAESDAKARQLLSEVREDKPPSYSYFLYLRAFETTRRLKAPLFLLDLSTFGLNRLWNNELEGHINGALLKVGPLIALGHPGENFGAGRVTTSDEEWMTDIAKLARNARGILLIPSHRPGTLWEIEHLQQEGLLSRTVFVMPPESRRFDWRSHWAQARRAIGELGAALPEYEDLGMLFMLDAARRVHRVESFSFFGRSLRRSIVRLLSPGSANQAQFGTDKAIRKARHRASRWRLFWRLNLALRATAIGIFALILVLGGRAPQPAYKKLPWSVFWDAFMNSAEIDERGQSIAGEFDSSAAYRKIAAPLSLAQQSELRAELTHDGFRRLDNGQLRTAYMALNQLLQRSNTPTCGAVAQGTLPADQLDRALVKLDPDKVTNWMDMNREAAIAEIEEKPVPAVSYSELVQARTSFEQSLKPDELDRYRDLTQPNTPRTIEDECWLARKKFAAVSGLPDPKSLAWARLLEFEQERPAVHALVKDPLGKLKALAAFQQRTQGMTDQQVSGLFGELVVKGIARLDDSTLLARFRAFSDVLEKADGTTCEAIAQGTGSTEQFEAALGNIPESGQAAFLDSQFRAGLAELEEKAKPANLTKAEMDIVGEKFVGTFSSEELARFNSAGPHKCWMRRKDFAAVSLMEEPYNRMWARNLAQQ